MSRRPLLSPRLPGLPPTVVSVNECDPLRDEGLALARKLRRAKVAGYSRMVIGTAHAVDLMLVTTMPDVYYATIDAVKSFAASCLEKRTNVWEAPPPPAEEAK